jgi:hypothetical protein
MSVTNPLWVSRGSGGEYAFAICSQPLALTAVGHTTFFSFQLCRELIYVWYIVAEEKIISGAVPSTVYEEQHLEVAVDATQGVTGSARKGRDF